MGFDRNEDKVKFESSRERFAPSPMEHSPTLGALGLALSQAQAELEHPKKTSFNPFHKSRYADLSECAEAVKGVLPKHGLSVAQFPIGSGSWVGVRTILLHSSGEYISGEVVAECRDGLPQSVGIAITYLRRYALCSVVGLAPEDDDGEAAHGRGSDNGNSSYPQKLKTVPPSPAQPKPGGPSAEELQSLREAVKAAKWATPHLNNHLKKHYGVETVPALTRDQAATLLQTLLKEAVSA